MIWKVAFLLAAFVGSTCTNAIIKALKTAWNKMPRQIIKVQEKTISIQGVLDQLSVDLNAYRTCIIRYKDERAYMAYESTKDVKHSIQQSFQGILATMLAPMLLELQEKGMVEVRAKLGDRIAMIHDAIGIESTYKLKLFKSISDGCLVVAFSEDRYLTESEMQIFKNAATQLRLLKFK